MEITAYSVGVFNVIASGEESRREKDETPVDVNGLSFSSHSFGSDDSISPTEGRSIPVLGSLIAAFVINDGDVDSNVEPKNNDSKNFRLCNGDCDSIELSLSRRPRDDSARSEPRLLTGRKGAPFEGINADANSAYKKCELVTKRQNTLPI